MVLFMIIYFRSKTDEKKNPSFNKKKKPALNPQISTD